MEYELSHNLQRRAESTFKEEHKTLMLTAMQVPPGQYLTCVAHGHIDIKEYWDLDYPDKVGPTPPPAGKPSIWLRTNTFK